MDETNHLRSIERLERGLHEGKWHTRDNAYACFLRNQSWQDSAEHTRKRFITHLALAGIYQERAAIGEIDIYSGRVGTPEKMSFIRVIRNECYLQLQATLKKSVRCTWRYNAHGRIVDIKCTALDTSTTPPTRKGEYLFVEANTKREEQQWIEKEITLKELGDK